MAGQNNVVTFPKAASPLAGVMVSIYVPKPSYHLMVVDEGILVINGDMSGVLQRWDGTETLIDQVVI